MDRTTDCLERLFIEELNSEGEVLSAETVFSDMRFYILLILKHIKTF